ncbi:MAG: GTPase [Nanoarchaeota archaeon]
MVSFWRSVNRVIQNSDVIIEVLDSRLIEDTRNKEIEQKIKKFGKKILYVINKCDLVNIKEIEKVIKEQGLQPSVFISSTEKLGTTILKKKIMELSRGEKVVVGVVGYPNVGKSSLINALSGRSAARTSSSSGFTHGIQKVRVGDKIILLDTPGVFPEREKNEEKHAYMGAIDYGKLKNPEMDALRLIKEHPQEICEYYNIEGEEDPEEILELIGIKSNKLLSKGRVNEDAVARMILKDWQTGKIRKK